MRENNDKKKQRGQEGGEKKTQMAKGSRVVLACLEKPKQKKKLQEKRDVIVVGDPKRLLE